MTQFQVKLLGQLPESLIVREEGGAVYCPYPSGKQLKNANEPVDGFSEKRYLISSVVSKILRDGCIQAVRRAGARAGSLNQCDATTTASNEPIWRAALNSNL